MSTASQSRILEYYNRIWEKGFVPLAWKHAVVVPILKPNKPKSDPLSYRPIALTSNFCKLMEKMIVTRINWFMEKNHLFNVYQSGFRKSRNTVDQLLRLSDDIIKSLGNKSSVLGVFIDFEKAYDMVWRKGLLFKLDKFGFDGNIFNWINAFLQKRSIQVRVGGTLSNCFEVENGLPQGSVISPVLFLVAINDLMPCKCEYSLFADDAAIWKTGKNIKHLERKMQTALDYIQSWCDKWGFKISIAKSSFVLFHKGKSKNVSLSLNGNPLKAQKKVKFLGMIFDSKLTWKDHIDYLVEKCQKRINILKVLSGSKWGANKETMVIVYKTLVRSLLDYGCIVYNSACDTLKRKLDVIQAQCLRLCCGALMCTAVSSLEVDCGIVPLELRRKFLLEKSAVKYCHMPSNPTVQCFEECFQLYYGKYNSNFQPVQLKIQQIARQLPEATDTVTINPVPFWEYDPPVFDTSLCDILSKKDDNTHFMLSYAQEKISSMSSSLSIYTDGSKSENKTGCAFYVPSIKYSRKIRLPDNSSVYSAELVAILEALHFLLLKPPISAVIFSDSLSSIQSLDSDPESSPLHLEIYYCFYQLWCLGVPITLCWIPSHIGVSGNEIADRLAKEALSNKDIQCLLKPNIHELYQMIEDGILNEWQVLWNLGNKGRFYHRIQPKTSYKVKYSDNHKEKQTAITRLRFGKSCLNDVMYLMNKRDNDLCDFCHIKEDVSHFLLDCIDFQELQQIIIDKFLNEGSLITLEALLGDKKWYDDVWNYVKQSGKDL